MKRLSVIDALEGITWKKLHLRKLQKNKSAKEKSDSVVYPHDKFRELSSRNNKGFAKKASPCKKIWLFFGYLC